MIPLPLGKIAELATYLLKHWKEVLVAAAVVWIAVCLRWHCGSGASTGGTRGDTLSVRVDTLWMPADTGLILSLHGFDTIPDEEHVPTGSTWTAVDAAFASAFNCGDSVAEAMSALRKANIILEMCDSLYGVATARRVYRDTLENDSIRVFTETAVRGFRIGTPFLSYVWLRPQPVITRTVTLEHPRHRMIGIGGELGPTFDFPHTWSGAVIDVNLNYVDRKNNAFKIEGGLNTNADWEMKVGYTRYFDLK